MVGLTGGSFVQRKDTVGIAQLRPATLLPGCPPFPKPDLHSFTPLGHSNHHQNSFNHLFPSLMWAPREVPRVSLPALKMCTSI